MMTNAIDGLNSRAVADTTAANAPASTAVPGVDAMASEQTFLKLFMAQLQHQDPTAPQDPTQFVTQLAQYSGLEQSLQMREDLDAILKTLQTGSGATNAPTPTTT
jgi:flagellar basal-body rod modification protein FlgD